MIAEKSKTPEPGIYENVPFQEYLAWGAFSKSKVKALLKSPQHYKWYEEHPKKQTDSMRFGSLVDCLLLEPELYKQEYAVRPDTYKTTETKGQGKNKKTVEVTKPWSGNAHVCQAIIKKLEAGGKTVISKAELAKAEASVAAILAHPRAAEKVGAGKKQVSLVWNDEETGVLCKARLDLYSDDEITDLKTARDASPDGFFWAVKEFLYHVQAAMYSDAVAKLTGFQLPFTFIVLETGGPFPAVSTYCMEEDAMLAGRAIYQRALARYKECRATGEWPGYSLFDEPIGVSNFALKQEGVVS